MQVQPGNASDARRIWRVRAWIAGASILMLALMLSRDFAIERLAAGDTPGAITIAIANTAGSLDPATTTHYTVDVTNEGGAAATGLHLLGAPTDGIDSARWTCTASGVARCPRASGRDGFDESIASLSAGAALHYAISASVARHPPAHVIRRVAVELGPDAQCVNGQSARCEAQLTLSAGPRVTIDNAISTPEPAIGAAFRYTLTVRNVGTVDAGGTVVRDPLPAGLARFDWHCSGSAHCPHVQGSGALLETIAQFPPGSSLTYTIDAKTGANPPPRITHTATANPPWGGSCGDADAIHAPPCAASAITPANALCDTAGGPPCAAEPSSAPAPSGTVGMLDITKQANALYLVPGGTVNYTVTLTNVANTGSANDITITDAVPAGIASFDSWTCTSIGSVECPTSVGSGPISETIFGSIPPQAGVVYGITATVAASPPDFVTNVASAEGKGGDGTVCSDGSSPPCSADVTLATVPLIAVDKQVISGRGLPVFPPGSSVAYSIVLENRGALATNVRIVDPVPEGLINVTWTCQPIQFSRAPSGSTLCPDLSGTGDIDETVAFLDPDSISFGGLLYQINGTVSDTPPGFIANVATVTTPPGAVCLGGSPPPCVSEADIYTRPFYTITKTSPDNQAVPGGTVTYEVSIGNSGEPSPGGTLADVLPEGIDQFDWTCGIEIGGVTCPNASGSGAINEVIPSLPSGGQLVYTITAQVSATASGSITNVAIFTPAAGVPSGCNSVNCDSAVTLPVAPVPMANLTVSKTADISTLIAGDPVNYTVEIVNDGSAAALATVLSDPTPPGLSGFTWTCASLVVGECPSASGSGDVNQTIPMLTSEIVYTINATVDGQPPPTITNIATIAPANGATCNQGVCTSTLALPTGMAGAPSLQVTKTTTDSFATPGADVHYDVSVGNFGTADLGAVILDDPIPAGIDSFAWTCAGDGATCPSASGVGSINQTIAALPVDGALFYSVTATVSASATGTLTNTASATRVDGAPCADPTLCTASVLLPVQSTATPSVFVAKSTTDAEAIPGGTVHYTVQVSNEGDADSVDVAVLDDLPSGISGFAWTCTPATLCPNPGGSGAINELLATLPSGSAVVYTVDATVASDATGSITNAAIASPSTPSDCTGTNCTSSVTLPVAIAGTPILQVSKSIFGTNPTPGGTVHYDIVVANTGDGASSAILLSDPVPAGLTPFAWVCSGTDCPNPGGSGDINETIAGLAPGAQVEYTVTTVVMSNPPPSITNTATATPSDGIGCVIGGSPCTSSATFTVTPAGSANIIVSKTVNDAVVGSSDAVSFTISIANQGSADAGAIAVSDPVASGFSDYAWTCIGNRCPSPSGSGAIAETLSGLPAGASVTYTLGATVTAAYPTTSATNVVTLAPANGEICSPANCSASSSVTVTQPATARVVVSKSSDPAPGETVLPGQAITWTLSASDSGAPTSGTVTLADVLPQGIVDVTVDSDSGVECSPAAPQAGDTLQCAIAAPFLGSRHVRISATIAEDAEGVLRNSVSTAGVDRPQCAVCTVSNPIGITAPGNDVALGNARAFSAAGLAGHLFDVVNHGGDVAVAITVAPGAEVELLSGYAASCTASDGDGGSVVVTCPDPPPMQGVHCSGSTCTVDSLPQGATITLFAAPAGNSELTVTANDAEEGFPDDNILVLPAPESP